MSSTEGCLKVGYLYEDVRNDVWVLERYARDRYFMYLIKNRKISYELIWGLDNTNLHINDIEIGPAKDFPEYLI